MNVRIPAHSPFARPSIQRPDGMIFVHSYVLTPKADGAERVFNGPPNLINAKGIAVCWTWGGTYERTDNPSIFDIATPIVSFLHSYVLTLKLTALAEAFSSPCFILRTKIFYGRP